MFLYYGGWDYNCWNPNRNDSEISGRLSFAETDIKRIRNCSLYSTKPYSRDEPGEVPELAQNLLLRGMYGLGFMEGLPHGQMRYVCMAVYDLYTYALSFLRTVSRDGDTNSYTTRSRRLPVVVPPSHGSTPY